MAVAGAVAVTGCGDAATATSSAGQARATASQTASGAGEAASGGQDQGDPIDVKATLVAQGFAEGDIWGVESNAAYWLIPFEMSKAPGGQPTCVFSLMNSNYHEGDAFMDHPIMSGSTVKLEAHRVTGDGDFAEELPQVGVLTVPLKDVTPAVFTAGHFDLSACGSTAPRR